MTTRGKKFCLPRPTLLKRKGKSPYNTVRRLVTQGFLKYLYYPRTYKRLKEKTRGTQNGIESHTVDGEEEGRASCTTVTTLPIYTTRRSTGLQNLDTVGNTIGDWSAPTTRIFYTDHVDSLTYKLNLIKITSI